MKNEITIVTAFFDIGRKNFGNFSRDNEEYFEYFKVWGKMKNNLVVYTYHDMAKKVINYRKQLGLEKRTKVVIIDDEYALERDIYEKMVSVSKNQYFLNYRYKKNAVSNNPKYDYIMLLKYWCLKDAFEKKYLVNDLVAWLDFGFNHGDSCYIRPEEFDFLWETDLDPNKIHMFALDNSYDEKPIFELIRTLEDHLMGSQIILPRTLCNEFWELIKAAINSILNVGFIDDDQLLILLAYRMNSKIFEIHISNWFMPLKESGASHLTCRNVVPNKKSIVAKIKGKIKFIIYMHNLYKMYRK